MSRGLQDIFYIHFVRTHSGKYGNFHREPHRPIPTPITSGQIDLNYQKKITREGASHPLLPLTRQPVVSDSEDGGRAPQTKPEVVITVVRVVAVAVGRTSVVLEVAPGAAANNTVHISA